MSHIFDDKKFKKLDSPERKKAMPVEAVMDALPIRTGIIADVGCGVGYFSKPFATCFAQVLAIDISEIMINEFKNRITENNIVVMLGDFNELIADNSLDVFFTATVIHELPDLEAFTKQGIVKLKEDGYIAYLDFEKNGSEMGPPNEKRIASVEVMTLFQKMNLKDIKNHPIGDNFYLVIGQK